MGKSKTLLIAILLMCAAQLSKIFCYYPGTLYQFNLPEGFLPEAYRNITIQGPYLILIPTILLSAGMLMFFTLGSSMVGDVCDEDELNTNTRSEGTYYSVFWWFIKMGTAFASFVTGALLVYTSFDERQNVSVDALSGNIAIMKTEAELWLDQEEVAAAQVAKFVQHIDKSIETAEKLRTHFDQRIAKHPRQAEHLEMLTERVTAISTRMKDLRAKSTALSSTPAEAVRMTEELLAQSELLKIQSPDTLFRLRLVEIGLPLLMSIVSIALTLRYPLTEQRCYEIKTALEKRRAAQAS